MVPGQGGTTTVTFTPTTYSHSVTDGATVDLGSFNLSGVGGFGDSFSSNFNLVVHQTNPVTGTGSQDAELSGGFFLGIGGGAVSFTSTTIVVPGSPPNVTYTLQNIDHDGDLDLTTNGTTHVYATVHFNGITSAPEPSNFLFGGFASLMALGYAWRVAS